MDLSKLTVPQLKALCKERRIVGYSKLGKAALIQRLDDTTSSSTSGGVQSSPVAPCSTPNSRALISPSPKNAANTEHLTPNKRPAHIATPPARKRVKTASQCAYSVNHSSSLTHCVPPVSFPTTSNIFKVPAVPPRRLSKANPELQVPGAPCRDLPTPKNVSRRFKPLTFSTPQVTTSCQTEHRNEETLPSATASLIALGSSPGMAFLSSPSIPSFLSFVSISLPPSISDRKRVQRWAVIFCGLDDSERRACCLVSRVIRYAGKRIVWTGCIVIRPSTVYLSAVHILERKHNGRRLDKVFQQHPKTMTNMWPYLQFRDREVLERRQAFDQSFLGKYIGTLSLEVLSERLWGGPDNDRQVEIALR